jgi:peptidoglycan/LPS O-acetylase OafA/YrhL
MTETSCAPARPPLPAVTSLRWFCAFYVFLFHFQNRAPFAVPPSIANALAQGAVGMAFFFVLSGFILTYVYFESSRYSLASYLRARFARIYPAYAITVALAFLVVGYGLDGEKAVVNVLANIFVLQGWFFQLFPFGINGGTWSLSVEILFYLLFPLLLPLIGRRSDKQLLIWLAAFWLATWIPGYVNTLFSPDQWPAFYSSPIYRLPEFIIGMCLGVLYLRGYFSRFRSPWIVILGSQAILFCCLSWQSGTAFLTLNWIAVPTFGILIYACALHPHVTVLAARWLVILGEISYGFYLYQFIPFHFLVQYANRTPAGERLSTPVLFLICIGATIAISAASYFLVEKPVRSRLSGRPRTLDLSSAEQVRHGERQLTLRPADPRQT